MFGWTKNPGAGRMVIRDIFYDYVCLGNFL
jgi:hypothetical protein